jgi:hypothetical protein
VKSRITKSIRKHFEGLPEDAKKQAKKAYAIWRENPYHRSLQFKRVSPRQPVYSVRVGLGWRALGLLEGDMVYWFWIGSHAQYEELLNRL